MALICFPFRIEDTSVVISNLRTAANHHATDEVLCVGYEKETTFEAVQRASSEIRKAAAKPVRVALQNRIGVFRPGKGDAVNTALKYFLEETRYSRIHFYDADITSFNGDWISRAERAADHGHHVVRHYYPRAATDGLITWFIAKTGFSLLWPYSNLARVQQPLGGELLLSREAAALLHHDPLVRRQSDWGIDAVLSFSIARNGISQHEVHAPEGKVHKTYSDLGDLREMLVECFCAVKRLAIETLEPSQDCSVAAPASVSPRVERIVAFDLARSVRLWETNWTDRRLAMLRLFPASIELGLRNGGELGNFDFMTDSGWLEAFKVLLANYVISDPDWEALLFQLWLARVINYTTRVAVRGWVYADQYLNEMLLGYQVEGARLSGSAGTAERKP